MKYNKPTVKHAVEVDGEIKDGWGTRAIVRANPDMFCEHSKEGYDWQACVSKVYLSMGSHPTKCVLCEEFDKAMSAKPEGWQFPVKRRTKISDASGVVSRGRGRQSQLLGIIAEECKGNGETLKAILLTLQELVGCWKTDSGRE